ncbi:hypothetical protein D3C76_1509030 [compost metagenome]
MRKIVQELEAGGLCALFLFFWHRLVLSVGEHLPDLSTRQPVVTYLTFGNGLDELRCYQRIAFKAFGDQKSCRPRTHPESDHADQYETDD